MKRTDITRTIASLLITAAMLGVTGCGNVNTDTSSAPPKATTTASSTEASATTTTEATLTSQSEETTSLSATTTGTSASTKSTSSSKSSTAPKNTAKANSSKASNGGTVNNGGQSYSGNTTNNGNGNNYQPAETQAPQTERQTERQTTTKRQTTTTAKKTKPKPTTTTTAKPKFKLTQNDIDRLKRELQAYSNDIARPRFQNNYSEFGYSSVDELLADVGWMNLDNSSWGTPDTVSPDTYSSYDELYRKVKGHVDDLYTVIPKDAQIVIYTEWHGDGSAINSDGKPAWEIYLIY
ncbi:hypothetical protein [Ruminococcus sp.]|uniref:hypothetical protein n=1 Tax=Ruminococcus sp. TaxID=41978 RepID=UPI003AB83434